MNTTLTNLRNYCTRIANVDIANSTQRFFKHDIQTYGIRSAQVEKIAKEYFSGIQQKSKNEIFALCKELLQSQILEEQIIACNWTYALRKSYTPHDLQIFAEWIDTYITNWASCDTFCNHSVGTLIEMYPKEVNTLIDWTHSKNQWMRRAAAVSLIVPARKGYFLEESLQIAEILLLHPEDMVQKGYGWLLKVAANKHEQTVFEFVCKHKQHMPRTSLRYAIEKMPKELRMQAMKKE